MSQDLARPPVSVHIDYSGIGRLGGGGGGGLVEHSCNMTCTVLLNEIQSQHHSSTRWALRSPRPANIGLQNGARHKLE